MFPESLSLTGGAGGSAGASGGTANNGLSLPMSTPFNFDSSGWVVNFDSPNAISSPTGNKGANATQQTATPDIASSGSGTNAVPTLGGLDLGGNTMPLILGAVGLFLVLSHKL